jgi:hypothetical protein
MEAEHHFNVRGARIVRDLTATPCISSSRDNVQLLVSNGDQHMRMWLTADEALKLLSEMFRLATTLKDRSA